MTLPATINTTYAPGSPVKSTDLNDIQTSIVNLHAGEHGDIAWTMHPVASYLSANVAGNANGYLLTTGGGVAHVPLVVPVGARIKSVLYSIYGDASNNMSIDLVRRNLGTATTLETTGALTPAAAWSNGTITVSPQITVVSGDAFFLTWTPLATAMRLGPINVTFDHP